MFYGLLLVAVGWAQWIINFVFWIHFLKPPYVVGPFYPRVALILIVVTTAIGYPVGYSLGLMWNWVHR
jgi:hypothetical protein